MSGDCALDRKVADALRDDRTLQQRIAGGGVLHLERRLPFLVVYRRPEAAPDKGTDRLVTTQASYLIAEENALPGERLRSLVDTIATAAGRDLQAFLLIELWSKPVAPTDEVPAPMPFRIVTGEGDDIEEVDGAVQTLKARLCRLRMPGFRPTVTVLRTRDIRPPAIDEALLAGKPHDHPGCYHIGIEVPAIYHDRARAEFYPGVLDRLRRRLAVALREAVSGFCQEHGIALTDGRAISLAPRRFEDAARECDREILDICRAFDLLMLATPVNAESAWEEFQRKDYRRAPVFYYRPLPFDPPQLKRRLFSVPLERIHDPVVEYLFEEKRLELDQQISLLRDRGSGDFLYGSLQLFGGATDDLKALAEGVLQGTVEVVGSDDDVSGTVDADAFCSALRAEIAWYRERNAEFSPDVEIRDDITAGLMVSHGAVCVSQSLCVPEYRVNPLIQHELGTHVVTHFNGVRQPFGQLAAGLAHYDPTQEGLAVLAEYAVGGLTRTRARTIAARVIAVDGLVRGDGFVDVFACLREEHGFSERGAYNITMRVFRGGGLTKDAVYLRGMLDVMNFLDGPHSLDLLLLGKISTAQAALVDELVQRGIVEPPAIRPRYCSQPDVLQRLLSCRELGVNDILGVAA